VSGAPDDGGKPGTAPGLTGPALLSAAVCGGGVLCLTLTGALMLGRIDISGTGPLFTGGLSRPGTVTGAPAAALGTTGSPAGPAGPLPSARPRHDGDPTSGHGEAQAGSRFRPDGRATRDRPSAGAWLTTTSTTTTAGRTGVPGPVEAGATSSSTTSSKAPTPTRSTTTTTTSSPTTTTSSPTITSSPEPTTTSSPTTTTSSPEPTTTSVPAVPRCHLGLRQGWAGFGGAERRTRPRSGWPTRSGIPRCFRSPTGRRPS